MPLPVTLGLFLGAALLCVLCLRRAWSPTRPGRVRMIPWAPLGLFFLVLAFMMLVHLANLAGMETGRR